MSNLFATLRSSSSALDALTEALAITQNNVSNAGSAGYARQKVRLEAQEFDPHRGLGGGVKHGVVQSTRDEYVERAVRLQNGKAAEAETAATSLTKLEQALPLSGGGSIPFALDRLYKSFSAWSVAPDDLASKENVVAAGAAVATAFRSVAQKLTDLSNDNAAEIRAVVDRVNRLAGRIQEHNQQIRSGSRQDAGLDAGIHASLDELAADVNLEAIRQEDGTFALLLAGEHTLVVGDHQYDLSVTFGVSGQPTPDNPDAVPSAQIFAASGQEITESVRDSRLASLLDFRHETLAAIQGDGTQDGELNRLARKIVDRLNEAWPPPSQPFLVSGASAVSVAHTLSVNPALAPAMLDAVEPGPPPVANGKALALAALANPVKATDKLDGRSFTEFYGQIASDVGGQRNEAKFQEVSQKQLSTQVTAFRDQISGVSLDEEALHLMEFQRAYQASARIVTVIDELLQTALSLGRS